jgi:hypothetical protein
LLLEEVLVQVLDLQQVAVLVVLGVIVILILLNHQVEEEVQKQV